MAVKLSDLPDDDDEAMGGLSPKLGEMIAALSPKMTEFTFPHVEMPALEPIHFELPPPPPTAEQTAALIDVMHDLLRHEQQVEADHKAERETDAREARRRFRWEMAAIVVLGIAAIVATVLVALYVSPV